MEMRRQPRGDIGKPVRNRKSESKPVATQYAHDIHYSIDSERRGRILVQITEPFRRADRLLRLLQRERSRLKQHRT